MRHDNSTVVLYEILFPNDKRYFGISNNLEYRKFRHNRSSINGSKFPVHLAIKKYGYNNIRWRVLVVGLRDYIKSLEISIIALFNTTDRRFGYNITFGGDSNPMDIPWVRDRQSILAIEAHARPATKIKHTAAMQVAAPQIKSTMLVRSLDPIWLHNVSEGTKKGLSSPDIRKRCGDATRDTKWINNGKKNRRIKVNESIPIGWIIGRFDFPSNGFWMTDGKLNRHVFDLNNIPDGWRRGMTKVTAR